MEEIIASLAIGAATVSVVVSLTGIIKNYLAKKNDNVEISENVVVIVNDKRIDISDKDEKSEILSAIKRHNMSKG